MALQVEVVGVQPDFFAGKRCKALLNLTFQGYFYTFCLYKAYEQYRYK